MTLENRQSPVEDQMADELARRCADVGKIEAWFAGSNRVMYRDRAGRLCQVGGPGRAPGQSLGRPPRQKA